MLSYDKAKAYQKAGRKEVERNMAADNFKKGSVELLTLHLLQYGDKHGYQLVQLFQKLSGGRLIVKEGSLYPMLYRMTEQGYICGEERLIPTDTGRSRMRVMYSITGAGRERLKLLREEYEDVHRGIQQVLEAGEETVNAKPERRPRKSRK